MFWDIGLAVLSCLGCHSTAMKVKILVHSEDNVLLGTVEV